MKKVLIITQYFKQSQMVGSIRLQGLAKYLPVHGWKPTILTVESSSALEPTCRIVETPFEDSTTKWKRRLGMSEERTAKEQLGQSTAKDKNSPTDLAIKLWEAVFAYPDTSIGWLLPGSTVGDKLLHEEHFDAILSSSGPVTTHLIAHKIREKNGVPWVADLRDLWTQNHYYQHWWPRRLREERLERRTLSTADALTTVSLPLADRLAELHEGKTIISIPNGFDPSNLNPGTPTTKEFSIIHAGNMFQGRRDPEPLLRAIRELVSEGIMNEGDVVIDFYGANEDWLVKDIQRHGFQDRVRMHGKVPRGVIVERERESQILLLLMWNHPEERGYYTGKLFEYLAARRPILSFQGVDGGVTGDLLRQTQAGVEATSYKELKEQIRTLYLEYKASGALAYHGIDSQIERYSHNEMAKNFSHLLNDLSG